MYFFLEALSTRVPRSYSQDYNHVDPPPPLRRPRARFRRIAVPRTPHTIGDPSIVLFPTRILRHARAAARVAKEGVGKRRMPRSSKLRKTVLSRSRYFSGCSLSSRVSATHPSRSVPHCISCLECDDDHDHHQFPSIYGSIFQSGGMEVSQLIAAAPAFKSSETSLSSDTLS